MDDLGQQLVSYGIGDKYIIYPLDNNNFVFSLKNEILSDGLEPPINTFSWCILDYEPFQRTSFETKIIYKRNVSQSRREFSDVNKFVLVGIDISVSPLIGYHLWTDDFKRYEMVFFINDESNLHYSAISRRVRK